MPSPVTTSAVPAMRRKTQLLQILFTISILLYGISYHGIRMVGTKALGLRSNLLLYLSYFLPVSVLTLVRYLSSRLQVCSVQPIVLVLSVYICAPSVAQTRC